MIPVVVTASPRDTATQKRCYQSLHDAGFRDITLSAEPGTDKTHASLKIMRNLTRRGQFCNMLQAIQLGLLSEAEYFVTCEDDVVFCRDVAAIIDWLPWPSDRCDLVQLYSSSAYPEDRYPSGRRSLLQVPHALDMLGACALLWRRSGAELVVDEAVSKGWRGSSYGNVFDSTEKRDGDTFIGEAMVSHKREIWIHNPSLADHIGEISTLGHDVDSPRRKSLNFPGEDVSAFDCVRGEVSWSCA